MTYVVDGMTLRDWFAGNVLISLHESNPDLLNVPTDRHTWPDLLGGRNDWKRREIGLDMLRYALAEAHYNPAASGSGDNKGE